MSLTIEEGGKLYLHLAEREMWFRLKYPNGKGKQEILKHENGTVLARATIYADYSTDEAHFLAQAYGAYTNSTLPEEMIAQLHTYANMIISMYEILRAFWQKSHKNKR